VNNPKRKLVSSLCLLTLSAISLNTAVAADREIGGYVDRAESRFVRNVWNFVKNFQTWQTNGGNRYKEVQYFWAEPYMFDSAHHDYVDKMDVAYVAGHGNSYYIQTNQSLGQGVDLQTVPAYGDLSNKGDLEFMIIESCYTVASRPESATWWTPYEKMFQGLHQLVGFHTLSNSDNSIPKN